jgi:hypothetical protein
MKTFFRTPNLLVRGALTYLSGVAGALLLSTTAYAWGSEGHQVIARLSQAQLSPAARKEVDRLLALEPGATLASVSTWPDEHRNPATAPWHYVNFPRDTCSYDAERDCPDGRCVIGAINRQTEILASGASDEQRLTALKYVVHFVGDVHQPLHAGYGDDRGGNSYQLQAFMRGSNLHALWDFGLIENLHEDVDALTARLAKVPAETVGFDAAGIAEESCHIVGGAGFYPGRKIDAAYIEKFTPVLEQRLALAGARLAALLNRIFR